MPLAAQIGERISEEYQSYHRHMYLLLIRPLYRCLRNLFHCLSGLLIFITFTLSIILYKINLQAMNNVSGNQFILVFNIFRSN